MILEEFHVIMDCPTCGTPTEAWPDHVPSAAITADTAGDAEAEEDLSIVCETCLTQFSVTIRAHLAGREVFLTDDPSVKGTFEHYDYRDDADPEPNSYAVFVIALAEWRNNVASIGQSSGASSRNRMLFVTLYSIIEAYLSDQIIGVVLESNKAQGGLLDMRGLKEKQVSLDAVLKNPHIVRDNIKSELRKVSFHNLEKVDLICRKAFFRPLLPSDGLSRAKIMRSVNKRHDCVHRNGRDEGGIMHADITQEYILSIASILGEMAKSLEDALMVFCSLEEINR